MWMTWKCAVGGHPLRRRQGRRHRRPEEALQRASWRALTRRFATEISILIGPERDIPAPDVNTNAQTMAWIMDTYSMHVGYTVPAVVTGKPRRLGGSEGRNEATARGCVFTHRRGRPRPRHRPRRRRRVVVQGFGNAGLIAAQLIDRRRREDRGRERLARRHQPARRPRRRARRPLEAGARHGRRASRAPRRSATTSCSSSTATS